MADQRILLKAPPTIREARDLAFFLYPPGTTHLLVDLQPVAWISPVGVVALLALCHRAERDGLQELEIVAPRDALPREYLSAIGFVASIEKQGGTLRGNVGSAGHSSIEGCLPVARVTKESEMEAAANALEATLSGQGAPKGVLSPTYLLMTELANNAWEHGSPCYVVAQTHSGRTNGTPGMHLAIADFGDGFRASLARYSPSSETEAMRRAFEEGVSASGDPKRGLGLSHVLEAVDNYRGARLEIVSRNGLLRREERAFVEYEGPDCGGVFVSAYFPFTREVL